MGRRAVARWRRKGLHRVARQRKDKVLAQIARQEIKENR